jgi:Transposase DDE domain
MDAKDVAVVNIVDVCSRMPLAEAALSMFRFVFDEQRLNSLWDQHRGRCYEKVISFPTMTRLVADALLQYGGSGRRSFEKNQESGNLESSVQAVFGKLGRMPLEVSHGFLREGTVALGLLFPRQALRQMPASLSAFEVLMFDGKAIKKVAKRLKLLRGVGGGLLGGKALVALHWQTGMALAMQTHPDGDASEKRLIENVVAQTASLVSQPRLFVGDRAYCGLVQTAHLTARTGDHFLVRYQSGTTFSPDPSRPPTKGVDSNGRPFVESWGWLGREAHKGRRYVRQIYLPRPGEDEDLILVTDLLDAELYPATDLLWLYHERWGIERVFQKVTEVFGLERLIGGTPEACIFQFAFCLLLYNLVQLLTSYVAQAQKCEVEEISKEKLFDDVRRELIAWNVVLTPEQTMQHFEASLSAPQLQARLCQILGQTWSETWRKAPRQENRRPPRRQGKRGHASVYRILQVQTDPSPPGKGKQAAKRC